MTTERTPVSHDERYDMLTVTPCCEERVRIAADRFLFGATVRCPGCGTEWSVEFVGVSGSAVTAIWMDPRSFHTGCW